MPEPLTSLPPPCPQRSNADKRRTVLALLRDPAWRQRSDRAIARQAGVHHQLVGRLRKMEESSTAPRPESAPAPSPPSRRALRIAEVLVVSQGLSLDAARRLLTRLQAMPRGKQRRVERMLQELLL